jgi:hypothetical protein
VCYQIQWFRWRLSELYQWNMAGEQHRFGRTYCLHIEGRNRLKMDVSGSSYTLAITRQTTRCHNLQDPQTADLTVSKSQNLIGIATNRFQHSRSLHANWPWILSTWQDTANAIRTQRTVSTDDLTRRFDRSLLRTQSMVTSHIFCCYDDNGDNDFAQRSRNT